MQYRAKEQIMLLEAFDLLKNSQKINPDLESPSSTRIDNVTEILRKNIVIPMHRRVKWGQYYANNNTTLLPAAAMGMASVVLHDNGDWILKINGHPKEWANAANYRINNTMWDANIGSPMSDRGIECGYAEGTHYFQYSFESLLPYFKCYSNFVPTNYTRDYRAGLLGFSSSEIKSYSDDGAYDRLYSWYNKILQPDGTHPSIDDGLINGGFNGVLALTKIRGSEKNGRNWNTLGLNGVNGLNLNPDYLCALSKPSEVGSKNKEQAFASSVQLSSGSVIFRSNDMTPEAFHYAHILAEPKAAIAHKPFGVLVTHDQADVGAITIGAMKWPNGNFELLTFDPPMKHEDDREDVKKAIHHNTVSIERGWLTVDKNGPDYNDEAEVISTPEDLADELLPKTIIRWGYENSIVEREVQVHRGLGVGGYYYVINDNIKNYEYWATSYTLHVNGNGKNDEGTFITGRSGTMAKWNHPCHHGRDWGIIADMHSSLNTLPEFSTEHAYQHGNNDASYITNLKTSDDKKYGNHSTLSMSVTMDPGQIFSYTTIITPYLCNDSAKMPIKVLRIEPNYGSQLVNDIGRDAELDRFHFNRNTGNNPSGDTIMNPFENNIYAILETDAKDGFFTLSKNDEFTNGGCITYTKFRDVYVSNSTTFKFNDTTYIESANPAECYYKIDGKFQYSGYCKTSGSPVSVNFFLPDMQTGFRMKAIGGSSYSYDTNTFIMSVDFPANARTKFVFELTDPCKLSCFYPDSVSNIVSTFTHDDGKRRPLGHPLKILQDTGRLNIYNGSQMSICPNYYLCNRDSLFLLKKQLTPGTDLSRCDMNKMLNGLSMGVNPRSAIIINENAALVLDSGSYTYVGANSSIYVKEGGSLIVKKGAVVEIGSLTPEGHGEIIAFNGSYLCIEDSTDIHFFKDESDTSDKNIFYAILQEQTLPGGVKIEITHPGVSSTILPKLLTDTILLSGDLPCITLCDLGSVMPPWGLGNREWGYAPFVFPKATYRIHNDTVCPGDSVEINLKHILNESGYEISVCRIDSPSSSPVYLGCLLTNDSGTFVDQRNQLALDAPNCIEIRRAPERFSFVLKDTGWYKIYVSAYNDCGAKHDTTGFIYVPPTPNVIFSIPDSACPGYGTVVADGSATISHVNSFQYSWAVSLITPDSAISENGEPIDYGTSWNFEGSSVQSDFDFPGFRWVGGFKYAVGLTVKGWCESVTKWDTINFPLMVMVGVHNAASYNNPVGPHAVQLEGFVSGATSWNWSPTDYLNYPDSLNPITTPPDSIVYILTGTSGDCTMSDTITIKHNTRANAGEDRNVCVDQKTVLGTDYNAAAILGLMYYLNGGSPEPWSSDYSLIRDDDINIQKYFTQRLVEIGVSASMSSYIWYFWYEHPEVRKAILNNKNFPTYFEDFINTNGDGDALGSFIDVAEENEELHSAILNLPFMSGTWSLSGVQCTMERMAFGTYESFGSWYNSKVSNSSFTDIIWEKKVDTTWVELTDWRGHYNLLADTNKTTTYRMTLIDSEHSLVEYDEVVVSIDTILVAGFVPAYQVDSAIYFVNATYEDNESTSYKWYFGDGDSSENVNPHHTFRAFDSVYYVCLAATNSCGTSTYCDSVGVDSSGLILGGLSKKENVNDSISQNVVKSTQRLIQHTYNRNENYLSVNVPNPFSELTTIEYATKNQNKNAEIRITNMLGQQIKTYPLQGSKGVLTVDGSILKDGLYFYSLVVDGAICESKRMMVRH